MKEVSGLSTDLIFLYTILFLMQLAFRLISLGIFSDRFRMEKESGKESADYNNKKKKKEILKQFFVHEKHSFLVRALTFLLSLTVYHRKCKISTIRCIMHGIG